MESGGWLGYKLATKMPTYNSVMEAEWKQSVKVKNHTVEVVLPFLKDGECVDVTIRRAQPDPIEKKPRVFGSAPEIWISDDFDEPLEDFKDYM